MNCISYLLYESYQLSLFSNLTNQVLLTHTMYIRSAIKNRETFLFHKAIENRSFSHKLCTIFSFSNESDHYYPRLLSCLLFTIVIVCNSICKKLVFFYHNNILVANSNRGRIDLKVSQMTFTDVMESKQKLKMKAINCVYCLMEFKYYNK